MVGGECRASRGFREARFWPINTPSQFVSHKRVFHYLSGKTSPEPTSGGSARLLCRQMRTDHDMSLEKTTTCSAYAVLLRLGLTFLTPALAPITRGHAPYA